MFISFPLKLMEASRRSCKSHLILFWLVGFGSGVFTAAGADNIVSLMRACCDAGVSIVGLLLVPLFPFLISAVAVYFSLPWLLCLTAFLKSFLSAFCACAVFLVFKGAGWLILPMLQFTDLMTLPVLYRFQSRHISGQRARVIQESIVSLLWFLAVSLTDLLWVTPLLKDII